MTVNRNPLGDDMSQSTQTLESRRTLAEVLQDDRLTEQEASAVMLALLESVESLHADGRIHGGISADSITVDASLQPALPNGLPSLEINDGRGSDDAYPLALRGLPPTILPTRIDAARRVLAEAGVPLDPRQIDLHQLGALMCRAVSAGTVSSYLRSPRSKAEVPKSLRPIIDRALGSGEPIESCARFAEAIGGIGKPGSVRAESLPESVFAKGLSAMPRIAPHTPAGGSAATSVSRAPQETPAPRGGIHDEIPFERLGHYRILERIGHGGMGDVYKAYDEPLERTVAIKVLPSEFNRHEDFLRRFRVEATAIAKLAHPNVVQIYFTGEDDGHHYFAMQYVDGESLADLLSRRGRLGVDEALPIVEQCLAGLGAAHEIGLIHRDVKPGNILLDRLSRRALVADFGLVKATGGRTQITMTGMVMGTADYLAPEQARGRDVDHRADLYAIGVMTYQMLAGRLPFKADSATAMMFQHAYEAPAPLDEVIDDDHDGLVRVVTKLMAKSPSDRYQSAAEVLEDLRRTSQSGGERGGIEASERDLPSIPVELSEFEHDDRWGRIRTKAGDWIARLAGRAPKLVARWQNTQQQVDGAVAEYERRRDDLQAMQREAASIAADLEGQAVHCGAAASSAAARAEAASGAEAKLDALAAQHRGRRQAADLAQLAAEQRTREEEIGFRLGVVEATLVRIRSQRNALVARLEAARAQVGMRSGSGQPLKTAVAIGAVMIVAAVVLIGPLVSWSNVSTSHVQVAMTEVAPPPVMPTFTMQDLSPLSAHDMNASGVAAGEIEVDGGPRAAVRDRGRIVQLDVPGEGRSCARAINDAGAVIGWIQPPDGLRRALFWRDPEAPPVEIGTFGQPASDAFAINTEGWVVVETWDPAANARRRASFASWLWHQDRSPIEIVARRHPRARAINDRRQVAGWRFSPIVFEGFIWDRSAVHDTGRAGWPNSGVRAISNKGQSVGWVGQGDDPGQAFVAGQGPLGTLGGARSDALDINDAGNVIGWSDTLSGPGHAFLYRDGSMHDLNDLVPHRNGWELTVARRIDRDGRILAEAQRDGVTRSFLLAPASGPAFTIANSIGMKLVRIEPGEFTMGSPTGEKGRRDDERQHQVRLTRGFLMGATEVTQSQWRAVMGGNPSRVKGDDLPVENVSWHEAVAFCRKLSAAEGHEYSLPTEAEWEYACRAGTTSPFSLGPTIDSQRASIKGRGRSGAKYRNIRLEPLKH